MDSQTAGRSCYIELELNTDDSGPKAESVSKDFFCNNPKTPNRSNMD
jgi:hypothetical protein